VSHGDLLTMPSPVSPNDPSNGFVNPDEWIPDGAGHVCD
jgi:hypothetical protein